MNFATEIKEEWIKNRCLTIPEGIEFISPSILNIENLPSCVITEERSLYMCQETVQIVKIVFPKSMLGIAVDEEEANRLKRYFKNGLFFGGDYYFPEIEVPDWLTDARFVKTTVVFKKEHIHLMKPLFWPFLNLSLEGDSKLLLTMDDGTDAFSYFAMNSRPKHISLSFRKNIMFDDILFDDCFFLVNNFWLEYDNCDVNELFPMIDLTDNHSFILSMKKNNNLVFSPCSSFVMALIPISSQLMKDGFKYEIISNNGFDYDDYFKSLCEESLLFGLEESNETIILPRLSGSTFISGVLDIPFLFNAMPRGDSLFWWYAFLKVDDEMFLVSITTED